MPEFYLTEPEIYEGDLVQALPQFFSVWGFLFGSAIAFSLFYELVNPTRVTIYPKKDTRAFRSRQREELPDSDEKIKRIKGWIEICERKSFWN